MMASDTPSRFVVPGDFPVQIQGSAHLDRLKPYGEVRLYKERPSTLEEKIARVQGAEVILNTRGAVTWYAEALKELPDLRLIATCSIGTDNIDLVTAAELGIIVSNQPGKIAPYVAEHIFGIMLAAAKRTGFQTGELKAGRWTLIPNIYLQGKTLGIIGTGNIGAEVARLANAFGMKVIAWTFHPSPEREAALGVKYVSLDELLRESDVVSLNVNLTKDTEGIIGERELAMMKPGALLVNGGRGIMVDKHALVNALNSGHLGGAAIDTYDKEPLPADDPILSCEQVVLTPHLADQTPEGIESLNEGIITNTIAYLEGRPQNIANPPTK